MYYGGGRGNKRIDTKEIVHMWQNDGLSISEIAKNKHVSRQRVSIILHKELGLINITFTTNEHAALKDLLISMMDEAEGYSSLSEPLASAFCRLTRNGELI